MGPFHKVDLRRTTEILANIALIACCAIFGAVLIRNYFRERTAPANDKPISLVGKKVALENVDWSQSDKNLLLVLSAKCRFCDESVPFYQRLVKETARNSSTRLIAAFPDAENENRRYLKEKMLDIADVRQVSPVSIGVRGTPALLLIDKSGTVVEQWMGKLPSEVEDSVISRVH